MFQLERVTKEYSGRRGSVFALRDIDLEIQAGSFVTITGPSGSGKTTLLLAIGGLIRPTGGTVRFQGTDIYDLNNRQLASYRNEQIGYVLQTFNLIPYLSAVENVSVPMMLRAKGNGAMRQKAESLMERVGLAERMHHLPRELSVGQQQRVAIARALANDPQAILADEPTGNLDPGLTEEILAILKKLNEEGRTVVMVTHSPQAAQIGNHRVHLRDGQRAEGPEPQRNTAAFAAAGR